MKLRSLKGKLGGYYYKFKYQFLLRKALIGSNFYVYCKFEIKGPGKIFIGDYCRIMQTAFKQDYVTLYTHNPEAKIILSNNVILRGTRMGCFNNIEIRSSSVIESASISDSDFHNIDARKRDLEFKKYNKPVVIEENSYIGCECIIGKGMNIGFESVVLAGTVISQKNIKPRSVVCGIPGRIKRAVF